MPPAPREYKQKIFVFTEARRPEDMASTMAKVIWLTLAAAAMPKTYDSHGCCMSCGELWCDGACTTDMAACASGASDLARCTFSWANLHWDLSPLRDAKPADQYYAISDNYVHSHQNWSYVVGVCRDVGLAAAPEACASTRGSGGETYDFPSPGYQIFKGDWGFEECYRLGSPVDQRDYAWGLIDPQSPAFGIYVQYKGGNTCTDSISDKAECEDVIDGRTYCARSLRINVVCNNRISDVPRVEEVVEKRGCEYALTLNSMYGCPTECPVSGGSVCGNRGVCAYDGVESGYTVTGDVGAARCLCKAPYAGAACEAVATAAAADERPPRNALFWVGLASLVSGLCLVAFSRERRLASLLSGLCRLFAPRRPGEIYMTTQKSYQAADETASPLLAEAEAFSDVSLSPR